MGKPEFIDGVLKGKQLEISDEIKFCGELIYYVGYGGGSGTETRYYNIKGTNKWTIIFQGINKEFSAWN